MTLGVLLAAGTGSRFEESDSNTANKLLADLDGEPVVTRAARTLTRSSLDAVVAVVGHDRERVADALPPEIEVIANPDYDAGQSTSIRRGVAVAREREEDSILFALGDLPCVSVETVDAILRAYREAADPGIVAPRSGGRRGNPVLFEARHFDALADVRGDRGGRDLLESEPVAWVDVEDPGIHRDVDTARDLQNLREQCEPQDESESSAGAESSSDRG